MVLNFNKLNKCPYKPGLLWIKKIGDPNLIRHIKEINNNNGDNTIKAKIDTKISIIRLINFLYITVQEYIIQN